MNILKQFYQGILSLSTGKKRKREYEMKKDEVEEDIRAVSSRTRTVSAPDYKSMQDRIIAEGLPQPAAQPRNLPTPAVFSFSAPTHHSSPALPPSSTGLRDRVQGLKLEHNIGPGRPHHLHLLEQQQQLQRQHQARQQQAQQPAQGRTHYSQHQVPQQQMPQHTQPTFLASMPPSSQGKVAIVAKQLHADFNDAALARAQRSGNAPHRSTSAASFPSSSAARPQPLSRPTHTRGLSRNQYMDIIQRNLREDHLQQWRVQSQQPKPVVTIDLTEDNDVDLQASRKALEEQLVLRTRYECKQLSLKEKMERLARTESEKSFAAADARALEIARKMEAIRVKVRTRDARTLEIQRQASVPTTAKPSAPAVVQQQEQLQQKKAVVEGISLLSDEDEEPQPDEEEEEEEEEEDEDQETEEDEDKERGWLAPEFNTPEELATWQLIFRRGSVLDERLAYHEQSSIPLTRSKLRCLKDGDWLNDEIINVAMALLQERDTAARQRGSSFPKCHFFNSFFLNKLFKDAHAYKYANVRRWTLPKRLASYGQASSCLLECDRLIVPVHCGQTHWACAVIDLQDRQLCYYDSLRGSHNGVLDHLAQWVVDEAKDKLGDQGLQQWGDALSWPKFEPQDVPVQNNGSDCGVFAIKFAECAGTGRDFDFSYQHMPRIRRALAHKVLRLKI